MRRQNPVYLPGSGWAMTAVLRWTFLGSRPAASGRVEWIGERGQLEADWQTHRLSCVSAAKPIRVWTVEPRPTIVTTIGSFARMVREGGRAPISGLDGQRAVEIAEACYQSAQENGGCVLVRHR